MSDREQLVVAGVGQGDRDADEETSVMFHFSRECFPAGRHFAAHTHPEDQLAWTQSGSVGVEVCGESWHLRSEHLLWIPAGLVHEMVLLEDSEVINLYLDPVWRPTGDWTEPQVLEMDPLAGALLGHLTTGLPTPQRRDHCRRLLIDLMADLPRVRDVIALPRDPRARRVATQLLNDPADRRGIDDWADELQVSSKTLARAFVQGTGSTFREWRVAARLNAATRLLGQGLPVAEVADLVGYVSVSSFIAAFKQRFGTTPARYPIGGGPGSLSRDPRTTPATGARVPQPRW